MPGDRSALVLLLLGGFLLGGAWSVWNAPTTDAARGRGRRPQVALAVVLLVAALIATRGGHPRASSETWNAPGRPRAARYRGSVKKVAILDYGSGNLRSAERALARVGADVTVTSDPQAALDADGLVVPGVGAFAACMAGLRAVDGPRIIGRRLAGGRPVLGICVGMQILFDRGVEHGHDAEGCGEWPGVVEQLKAPVLPHMGWNTVEAPGGQRAVRRAGRRALLLRALLRRPRLPARRRRPAEPAAPGRWSPGPSTATGSSPAWRTAPLSATQFHPEKSGDAGAQLLTNWLATLD